MSQTKENLVGVLDTITQNRKQLSDQIETIRTQQLPNLEAQLNRFDSLIASLQVSIADETTLAAVERQQEMGANVPLAPPAGGAASDSAGAEAGASQAGGDGAAAVSSESGDGSPAA